MLTDLLESIKVFGLCPMGNRTELKRLTQETHDQSLKCGEELQNQCLFRCYKSVNINLLARLSVVKITICILHCDKHFYKSTPENLINV